MASFGAGGGSATGQTGGIGYGKILESLKLRDAAQSAMNQMQDQQLQGGIYQSAVRPGQILSPSQRLAMVMRQIGRL
jgi:hypothetical protein